MEIRCSIYNIGFENAVNMYQNQGNTDLSEIIRLWSLQFKYNAILEMLSDSDIHFFKLDGLLEGFTIKTERSQDQDNECSIITE